MDTGIEDAEVIDLFNPTAVRGATAAPGAARSVVFVLPAEDGTRIVVTGPVGSATAAALTSHLAALEGEGQVTVDLTGARIDDPVGLAWALRRKAGRRLRLVGRSEELPPTGA